MLRRARGVGFALASGRRAARARAGLARADDRIATTARGSRPRTLRRTARRPSSGSPEHVVQLVDERVAPADDVSRRPPVLPERMVRLRHEHRFNPRARSPSARKTCSSFSRSMSNASEPFEPLISHWNQFRRPARSSVASIVPTAPLSNSTAASSASSTRRPGRNVFTNPETVAGSPARNRARSTTCIPQVAERSGTRPRRGGSARCRGTGSRPRPGGSGL